MLSFQELIAKLNNFWSKHGVVIGQPYGIEVGAGTSNPLTAFRVLGPEPFNVAYVEPSRRPADGRYGENPNRLQHYFQYQIILKPAPRLNTYLYTSLLEYLGIDTVQNDIRFVEDNWESPSLGAWGLGWEIWLNGMEITQYTYFQQMAGIDLEVPALEITIGLERLAMYLQQVENYKDLKWNKNVSYGDIFKQHEYWQSKYNYETSNIQDLQKLFDLHIKIIKDQLKAKNYWAAYDNLLKVSHIFNLLDARGVISVSDRAAKFKLFGELGHEIAKLYLKERKKLNYPLLKKVTPVKYEPPHIKFEATNNSKHSDTLIIELGFEEIPAQVASEIALQITTEWLNHQLADLGYNSRELDTAVYITPQRIVFKIQNIPEKLEKALTIIGPPEKIAYKNNKPTQVLTGFLNKHSLTLKDISIKNNKIVAQKTIKLSISNTAQTLLNNFINSLKLTSKACRWDSSGYEFIRPLRWIFAAYNNKVLQNLELLGVKSENFTLPPRYLQPQLIKLNSAFAYLQLIQKWKIKLNHTKRQEIISNALKKQNVNPTNFTDLILENTFLTENPNPVLVELPKEYYKLPFALIKKILEKNQRYIVFKQGKTIKYFVIVNHFKDKAELIANKNAKVVHARLDDGLFYLNMDLKTKLADFRNQLKYITYHPKKGSYLEKVKRIFKLAKFVPGTPKSKTTCLEKCKQALDLIKNDKATMLGKEFPELEGYIGAQIAKLQNYPESTAKVLEDYVNFVPSTFEGKILATIDIIDDIVNFVDIKGLPKGNTDPYKIRYMTYRLINIAKYLDLDLAPIFKQAIKIAKANNVQLPTLTDYINDRILKLITNNTKLPNHFAKPIAYANHLNVYEKLKFANKFATLPKEEQERIFDGIKRVHNILNKAKTPTKKTPLMPKLLAPEEQQILNWIKNYKRLPKELSTLAKLLEKLFENVLILDKDTTKRQIHLQVLTKLQDKLDSTFKWI